MKNDNELKEIRQYLKDCYIAKANFLATALMHNGHYRIQLKAWCIAIFMGSLGFCLLNNNLCFYFLPFFTVLIFWFYNAHENYLQQSTRDESIQTTKNLKKIYELDNLDELKKLIQYIDFEVSWPDKGKINPKRFLHNKIPGILNTNNFLSFENLSFYGVQLIICYFAFLFALIKILFRLFL
jgi:hypothetical protein